MDENADGIYDLLEKSNHPFFVWKYLIIFLGLNFILLGVIALGAYWGMFFTGQRNDGTGIIWILVTGVFALGFLIGYFVFRLVQNKITPVKPVEQGLFSKIDDENTFERKMRIYLVSTVAGLINLGVGFLVYSYCSSF